jgi:transposase
METPEDVAQMLRLRAAGLGIKSIARKMGCSKNTVRRYLRGGGWVAYKVPQRERALRGLDPWLAERLQQHRGNADVVRQDLERQHRVVVSLRTVERAVAPFRRELRAAEVATVRFETAPGGQLQIDFGETTVSIAGERVKVHLFVATLGYSRRPYVAVFDHQRQSAWWGGIEGAFHHFRGRPRELLLDNARPLVNFHDAQTREVRFNDRFYEGVCQAPLNSDVQWFSGSSPRDTVVVTSFIHDSVAGACLSLIQGATEIQGRGVLSRARCSV